MFEFASQSSIDKVPDRTAEMKVVKLNFFISSFLFGLSLHSASVRCNTTCVSCAAPVYNLSTPAQINNQFINIVQLVWSQNLTLPQLSCKFKNMLIDIVKAETNYTAPAYRTSKAIFCSIYFSNYMGSLDQERDVCALSGMINATVAFVENQDRSLISDALTNLEGAFFKTVDDDFRSTIIRSGCGYGCGEDPIQLTSVQPKCYKDGFVYPIKKLWNLPGQYSTLPCKLRDLVYRMYKSCNYLDRLLAAIMSFTMSEIVETVFNRWDQTRPSQSVDQRLTKPIEKVCCYAFIKRTRRLTNNNKESSTNNLAFAKNIYAAPVNEPCEEE